jgi:hypothetical protein
LLPGKVNYLLGDDPSKWVTDLPTYSDIVYNGLYPGVDLTYSGNDGRLKGTYTVAPHADASQLRWKYTGAQSVSVSEDGSLQVVLVTNGTGGTEMPPSIVEQAPVAWQEIDGGRVAVDASYALSSDGIVSFQLGMYDPSYLLTIDPLLTYSTYLGGAGFDQANGITVDSAGNTYVAGYTDSSNFPTANPLQPTRHGGSDAFITKMNPSGSALIYSTYLGGTGNDYGQGIAVDATGNVFIGGYTSSTNFPTTNPLQATNRGGFDGFVAKLNASGSALVYSTYLGGSGDDRGMGMAVDGSGNAMLAGYTDSTNFNTANAYQPNNGGSIDVFVSKLNPSGSALVYSTYLGNISSDLGYAVAADAAGNAYVTGYAYSENFPTVNAFQPLHGGTRDAFITKMNPSGSALVYSTFLGGSEIDEARGIAVDGSGNVYVTGRTASANFPLAHPVQPAINRDDAFATKLNAAGSALVYSTFLGGTYYEEGFGIAADSAGNTYVAGYTDSDDFPTVDAIQPTHAGREDAFVTKINTGGTAFVYSTYLGGSEFFESIGRDFAYGVAADSAGNAYVAGSTESLDFPTVNAFQPHNGGGYHDAFVARFSNQTSFTATPTRTLSPTITPGGPTLTPTPGCAPNWQYVPAPREREYNGLGDVSGTASNDVWAVGGYHNVSSPNPNTSLTMHWDGSNWTAVPNTMFAPLNGVVSIAPDDVWAVGEYANGSDTESFAAHWDGTAWTRFPTPTRPGQTTLLGVDALASNHVWAVGYNHGFHATIVEHWNGAYWAIVPSPPLSLGDDYILNAVTAIATDDVWAVGYVQGTSSTTTLIEHWNGTEWSIVPSPNPGNYLPHLYGVDAVSANDIWAVGTYSDNYGETYKPLFVHWDGISWTHVSGEFVPTYDVLHDVNVVSATDIWAVGVQADCSLCLFTHTFVMHWDGTSWTHVYSPDGPREVNGLGGVVAITPGDVWAVGTTADYTTPERYSDVLIIHQQCAPPPTSTGTPPSATPSRTRTPSATPTTCSMGTTNYTIQTTSGATIVPATQDLGLHCDECLTTVQLPFSFRLYDQQFSSVIVGSNGTMGFAANSNTWRTTCMPSQEFNYAILPYWQDLHLDPTGGGCSGCGIFTLVEGSAPNRVFDIEWRARDYFYTSLVNVEVRLYENAPGGRFDVIYGTVPSGSNQQVTVGVQKEMGLLYTQYVCENQSGTIANGTMLTFSQPACTTPTPVSATHTATSAVPTATGTRFATGTRTTTPAATATLAMTATATTTPGACNVQFTDVQPGSAFYEYVRCLACQGIINGYPCGGPGEPCNPNNDPYFRPQNPVTRGQIAKIVSLSAGYSENIPPDRQTFEDVAPSSTFWLWIERISLHGVVQGYPCGGSGEPCDPPSNRPYFRPNGRSTRGQLSKMVVLASGMPTNTEGGPHFTDTHPGSTFYEYVETLYNAGAISGYPDGTFRPNNTVTRGQASKITANAFFPDCAAR